MLVVFNPLFNNLSSTNQLITKIEGRLFLFGAANKLSITVDYFRATDRDSNKFLQNMFFHFFFPQVTNKRKEKESLKELRGHSNNGVASQVQTLHGLSFFKAVFVQTFSG